MRPDSIDPILDTDDLVSHRLTNFMSLIKTRDIESYRNDPSNIGTNELESSVISPLSKKLKARIKLIGALPTLFLIVFFISFVYGPFLSSLGSAILLIASFLYWQAIRSVINNLDQSWYKYTSFSYKIIAKPCLDYISKTSSNVPDFSKIESSTEVQRMLVVIEYNKTKILEDIESTLDKLQNRRKAILKLPDDILVENVTTDIINKLSIQIDNLIEKKKEVNATFDSIDDEINQFDNQIKTRESIVSLKLAEDDIEAAKMLIINIDNKLYNTASNIRAFSGAVRELADLSKIGLESKEQEEVINV